MEYMIVTVSASKVFSDEYLATKVNKHIEEGWKPQGGVTYGNLFLYQAMVREVKA